MKCCKYFFILAVGILFFIASGRGEARPCPKCVVSEVLEHMPTSNARELKGQMRRLAKVPEDGIRMIAAKFLPAGKGDNSTYEFTLTSFVVYVQNAGKDKLTERAKDGFFNAIPKCRGAENKGFLITLVAQLCVAEDIPRFEPYLENEALAPYAEYAIEYIQNR